MLGEKSTSKGTYCKIPSMTFQKGKIITMENCSQGLEIVVDYKWAA